MRPEIYADLLPDEFFLIDPVNIIDKKIPCPVCKSNSIYKSGQVTVKGKEYNTYTCNDCGELYYGKLSEGGALTLRFYSDLDKLDPMKNLQDQLTNYLIQHKSVSAYQPKRSEFESSEVLSKYKDYSIKYNDLTDDFELLDSKGKLVGFFPSDEEAFEYVDIITDENNESKDVIDPPSIYDDEEQIKQHVNRFTAYTKILLRRTANPHSYVIASDSLTEKELKNRIRKYNNKYNDHITMSYDDIKDAFYIQF